MMSTTETNHSAPKKRRTKKGKRKPNPWIPDQHGAWVMVTLPLLLGIGLATPQWIHLPLTIAWYAGYGAFFAVSLFLKMPAKRRGVCVKPMAVYSIVAALASVSVLAMNWHLMWWALCFTPLVIVAVYEAFKKRPRSLVSGESTVIASALLIPVCVHAAHETITVHVWAATIVIGLSFMGAIPYVKTLIRNRNDVRYFYGSIIFHVLAVIITSVLVWSGWLHWFTIIAAAALAIKSWFMPWWAHRRGTPWKPIIIGNAEIPFTILTVIGVFMSV